MNDLVVVYSTFPDQSSAARVAEELVRTKLAACANLSAPITSVYEWQGKLESSSEIAALFKTRRALAERLIEAARPLHPYSVPCFLILPVEGGSSDYLNWVRAQTLGSPA
jgi:periplasmic divalent cation tolerance protein